MGWNRMQSKHLELRIWAFSITPDSIMKLDTLNIQTWSSCTLKACYVSVYPSLLDSDGQMNYLL